jgi:hypothetical protein
MLNQKKIQIFSKFKIYHSSDQFLVESIKFPFILFIYLKKKLEFKKAFNKLIQLEKKLPPKFKILKAHSIIPASQISTTNLISFEYLLFIEFTF